MYVFLSKKQGQFLLIFSSVLLDDIGSVFSLSGRTAGEE